MFSLENAKSVRDINEIYEEISENIITKKEFSNKKQKKIKKIKKSSEPSLSSIQIDDFTIYVGKNNIQNDYIRSKIASPNDIWFHIQKLHGSHVLLKNPQNLILEDLPEDILFKAAILAKENSKAKLDTNAPVDYCYAKFVKKAPNSKPGMVIYSNFQTIIVK